MVFHATAKSILRGVLPALAVAGLLALAGCATQPYGGGGYGYGSPAYGGGYGDQACRRCGTVQSVRQVYLQGDSNSNIWGSVIGAVAGGLLGNTVGGGDGRQAATVAGAVVGGIVGNKVADRNDRGGTRGYRVVVRLDDGRMATVTQREPPRVDRGDRVQVRDDRVYRL